MFLLVRLPPLTGVLVHAIVFIVKSGLNEGLLLGSERADVYRHLSRVATSCSLHFIAYSVCVDTH